MLPKACHKSYESRQSPNILLSSFSFSLIWAGLLHSYQGELLSGALPEAEEV